MLSESEIIGIERKTLDRLREKLGVKAPNLERAMKRAGRRLPREAHRAASVLVTAKSHASHPRLSRMIDPVAVQNAQAALGGYLDRIDPKKRRTDRILSMLAAQALNLLGVIALVIGLMLWRGLL